MSSAVERLRAIPFPNSLAAFNAACSFKPEPLQFMSQIDFIRKKRFEENLLRYNLKSEVKSQDQKETILLREDKRLLDEAIKLLNEKEKTCLELNYIAGKKHKEIAEIFNISINSVSTIIARAKDKMKRHIEPKE